MVGIQTSTNTYKKMIENNKKGKENIESIKSTFEKPGIR